MKDLKRSKDIKFDRETTEKLERIVDRIKTGRPVKYDPDYHPFLLIGLFKDGNDIEVFCYAAEIHRAQFHRWIKTYPDFKEAYEYAKDMALRWWKVKAHIGLDDPSFNNTLWSMMMRNRFRLAEHRPVKVKGLGKSKNTTQMMQAINKAITRGDVTGSEINYLSTYLSTNLKIEEEGPLQARLKAMEDTLNETGRTT